jgi:hypothetical protein
VLIPLLVFPIFAAFAFISFRVLHNLFMEMKENDPVLWKEMGKPWCKITIPFDQEKMSIPPKVVFLIYFWVFKAPSWALASQKGRKAERPYSNLESAF